MSTPDDEAMNLRVKYMLDNLRKLEEQRHQFSVDHGFAWERPEHFKDCVVIRWKHRKRKDKGFIDHERINEYTHFAHEICVKYGLYDEAHVLLDLGLMLLRAGIYRTYSWHHTVWAIPNSNKDVKAYVLENLPGWANVVEKA